MKKTFTLLSILVFYNTYAQNIDFSDTKFKKLLLTSNNSNKIAINVDGESFAIDANNDGEIDQNEASRIKILNVKQDSIYKYVVVDGNKKIDEDYYQAHLPENINDLDKFKNIEEIYVYDTKKIDLKFKDNNKLNTFKVYNLDSEYGVNFYSKNVIFENCYGITTVNNKIVLEVPNGYPNNVRDNKISFINCPNLIGEAYFNYDLKELLFVNTKIEKVKLILEKSSLTGNLIKNINFDNNSNLKSIIFEEEYSPEYYSPDKLHLYSNNNINLEDIMINEKNNTQYSINELILSGDHKKLKLIKGLNSKIIDLSTAGLTNLEELDISFYNRYKYFDASEIIFGDVEKVNLGGLPNLKFFKGFNQKFNSIDLSNNPKIEEVNLINTIDNFSNLVLDNYKNLKSLNISQINEYRGGTLTNKLYYNLKKLIITNNPSLFSLDISNLRGLKNAVITNNSSLKILESLSLYELENFELNNNSNLEELNFGKSSLSYVEDKLYKLKSLKIDNNKLLSNVHLGNTLLEELNLCSSPKLESLDLNDNSELKFINIKNDSSEFMRFTGGDNLKEICADENDIEYLKFQFPDVNINSNCNCESSSLSLNNQLEKLSLTVYPNPVKNIIEIKSSKNILFIEIISFNGHKVYSEIVNKTNFKTNISNLNNGVYFIKINLGDTIEIKKIIKK